MGFGVAVENVSRVKELTKHVPSAYAPAIAPPFFRFMLARAPEKRRRTVELTIQQNEQKRNECKSLDVEKRLDHIEQENLMLYVTKKVFALALTFAALQLTDVFFGRGLMLLLTAPWFIWVISTGRQVNERILQRIAWEHGGEDKPQLAKFSPEWYNTQVDKLFNAANEILRELLPPEELKNNRARRD